LSLAAGLAGLVWLLVPLRLAYPAVNHILSLLCLVWIPGTLGVASLCLLKRWVRILVAVPFILIAVLFALGLFFSMVAGGPYVSYEILDTVQLRHSRVVAYRLNGGATVDYSVLIVQELSVLPGIVLVKDLHNGYHEYTATLRSQSNSLVAVINGVPVELAVRDFVYY